MAKDLPILSFAYLARTRVAGDGVGSKVTSVKPASWSQLP